MVYHAESDLATGQTSIDVAVATNFTPTLKAIANRFEAKTSSKVRVMSGSTGKLYAQVSNGLQVDVFLSADSVRVDRLIDADLAEEESRITYAIGRLVWWQPGGQSSFDQRGRLALESEIGAIALAQPKLAPYGLAAKETIETCTDLDHEHTQFVYSENIGQTFVHVATRNAVGGFVALANVLQQKRVVGNSFAIVPSRCHAPINQDAVVLSSTKQRKVAWEFLQFLQQPEIKLLITSAGYETP
ncbi:MAG: molybdate ABC transporter substrate-binding protein [Gammaproteobacteria bacterium]|nr:molybdate ABC transporter substrate-binding protein [Gammaproteobacteria bacterium]